MRIFGTTSISKLVNNPAFLITLILFLFLMGISEPSGQITKKNLKEIKDELLKKDVILLGWNIQGNLSNWSFARENPQGEFERTFQFVPYKMKGTRGVVVFIGQSKQFGRKAYVDAFGEKIRDEDIIDPLLDVIVKLQDGKLVMHTGYYVSITHQLQRVSDFEQKKDQILNRVDSMVGKTIYPLGYSCVFPPDFEVDKMARFFLNCRGYKLGIPNLTPLKIVKVKYLEDQNAILLKVKFLNDQTGLIFGDLDHLVGYPPSIITEETLFEKVIPGFCRDIKKSKDFEGITEQEIEAIKKGTVFIGMSQSALEKSIGFADKENDWGSGGKQLIYGERIYVYIRDGKVIDWQVMSK